MATLMSAQLWMPLFFGGAWRAIITTERSYLSLRLAPLAIGSRAVVVLFWAGDMIVCAKALSDDGVDNRGTPFEARGLMRYARRRQSTASYDVW
jgi:hypothetical protein